MQNMRIRRNEESINVIVLFSVQQLRRNIKIIEGNSHGKVNGNSKVRGIMLVFVMMIE